MTQIIQGIMTRPYEHSSREKSISFSFPLKGYEKINKLFLMIKKLYKRSFVHDFYSVITSKVE